MRTVAASLVLVVGTMAGASAPIRPLPLAALEADIARHKLGSIVALASEQDGAVAYRKRFDGRPLGELVDIRSAGKSITALAVGAAIADGKLASVDVRVWPYLGVGRGEPFDSITVRDLMTMSSALDCFDGDPKSPGQEERMYRTKDWLAFALALPSRDHSRDATGLGSWRYCTAGVFLLGQVVEKAVGERFDLYVQHRLFDPLGIHGAIWRRSPTGQIQSGGQLRLSDTDLLKIGRMVLDGGTWNGQRLLPESWIREMLTPHRRVSANMHYGYLWWALPIPTATGYSGAWAMQGNGGTIVAVERSKDAVLVVQGASYNNAKADEWSITALASMLAALSAPIAR